MTRGRYTIPAAIAGAILLLAVGAITALALGAFKTQDRVALAQQTVHQYWTDIDHARMAQAYAMLSPGDKQSRPFGSYTQDMYSFLESTAGVTPSVGTPAISGNVAVVPVTLHSPKTTQVLHAYQHLFWNDSRWQITDANGGLSSTR